jgi:PAS domain S-box-containing protein
MAARRDTPLAPDAGPSSQNPTNRRRLDDRARIVLESITDGFYLLDTAHRVTFANQRALDYYSLTTGELIGKALWNALPRLRNSAIHERFQWAIREDQPVGFETLCPYTDGWLDIHAYPSAEGLSVYFQDVTDRKRAEARDRFLVALDDATRGLVRPEEIAQTAARLLGQNLGVERCAYADVESPGTFDVIGDYCAGVPSIKGRYPIEAFGREFTRLSLAGEPFIVEDAEIDPRTHDVLDAYRRAAIRAVISVPLLKDGMFVGGMAVHQTTPRRWRAHEVDLVRLVANRCWESLERAAVSAALRTSEARLQQALAIAELGTFDVDLRTDRVEVNEPGRAIFGWAPDEGLTFARVETHFHPDDRARAVDTFAAAMDPSAPGSFEVEHRIVRTDGRERWIRVRGQVLVSHIGDQRAFRCLGTYLDVTDRRAGEEHRERLLFAERAARADAERLGRLKDEFLATVSHELRTPLNAILGWSQLLERRGLDGDEARRALETIRRNARAQAHLIDDLLDMNRIVTGKIRLEMQAVDVAVTTRAAIESVQPTARAKGVQLRDAIEGPLPPVFGDPTRLQQIVWNILSNAIKFTPSGGSVDVRVRQCDGDGIEIGVTDSGAGIAPEFLPHIFEPFRQQDASATRRHGGVGLGLSIVKQLVDLHGGTVHVASAGEGHGARFIVTLPRARAADGAAAAERPSTIPDRGDADARGSREAPGRAVRVMVVDDANDALQLLTRALENAGLTVSTASSAQSALARLSEQRVDVLVSDIGMPDMDGYDLIRRLRASTDLAMSTLPAIAVSAYARDEDRERALAAGYQMHIAKPVDLDLLVSTVIGMAATRGGSAAGEEGGPL